MTQQAVINQEKFVRIGGEIIDEITEITVNSRQTSKAGNDQEHPEPKGEGGDASCDGG